MRLLSGQVLLPKGACLSQIIVDTSATAHDELPTQAFCTIW